MSIETLKSLGPAGLRERFGEYIDRYLEDPTAILEDMIRTRPNTVWGNHAAALLALFAYDKAGITVSAESQGATGDGTTDDAAAIQAAIASVAASGGGTVTLGPGTFLVGSTITLASGVRLQGSGVPSTIIRGDNLTSDVLVGTTVVAYAASPTIRAPQIRDLLIDNQDRANAGAVGLDISGCYDAVVDNVTIQNCETGLRVTNSSYWNRFQGVRVATTDTAILVTQNANHNTFVGCHVITTDVGVHVLEGADAGVSNTVFLHLAVEQFGTAGLGVHLEATNPNAVDNVMLLQPRLENTSAGTTVALTLTGTVRNATMVDPLFVNVATEVSGAATDTTIRWRGQEKGGTRIGVPGDYSTTGHGLMVWNVAAARLIARNSANSAGVPFQCTRVYLTDTVFIATGTGSPEGVLTAGIGSTYHRLDGGASTTLYVKESGTGNTGWIAK